MTKILPSVSVIIPVYNGERFIRDAISSALSQRPAPAQVIVVDDGSTDATPRILSDFGDSISVVRQKQSGVAAARNAGIDASTSDCIALLDADDLWLPDKLLTQRSVLAAEGVAFVGCGYMIVDELLRPRYAVPGTPLPEWVAGATTLDRWGVGLPFTLLAEAEAVRSVGGFDPLLSTSADLEFALKLVSRFPSACVREPLALYRTHRDQMHLDLHRFQRDIGILYERIFAADTRYSVSLDEDRAFANVHLRLAVRRASGGDWGTAGAELVRSVRRDATRVFMAPIEAATRRWRYSFLARRQTIGWDVPADHSS